MGLDNFNLDPEYLKEYNGNQVRSVSIAFIVINTVFVALRFVSRRIQKAPFATHDFFVALSWLFIIAFTICCIYGLRYGVGYHIERIILDGDMWKIPYWGKFAEYIIPILHTVAETLPRISVIFVFLEFITGKFSRASCWMLIAFMSVTAVVNIIVMGTQCFPVEKAWNPYAPGHCHNIEAHFIYGAIPNVVTDVGILLVPIPTIRKLQVARPVKIGLLLTFALAGLGLITAILRLIFFKLAHFKQDPTFNSTQLAVWIIIQDSIYLICACMLMYRPLLLRILDSKVISTLTSSGSRTTRRNSSVTMTRKKSHADSSNLSPVNSKSPYTVDVYASDLRSPSSRESNLGEAVWLDIEPAAPEMAHANARRGKAL